MKKKILLSILIVLILILILLIICLSKTEKNIVKFSSTTKLTKKITNTNSSTTIKNEKQEMDSNIDKETTIKSENINTKQITNSSKEETTTTYTTTTATTTIQTTTQSCTPKKFGFKWFSPDFTSQAECEAVGESFVGKDGYYGYDCTYTQDDCMDYYYMLTLFHENGNVYYKDIAP